MYDKILILLQIIIFVFCNIINIWVKLLYTLVIEIYSIPIYFEINNLFNKKGLEQTLCGN